MQKGLILYMGYYGRYTAAYSIGCLLMLSLYIAGIFSTGPLSACFWCLRSRV